MPVINQIKVFIDSMGITPYQFMKDTGVAPGTAYNLYNNPSQVPHVLVLNKICDRYKVQPCTFLKWVPPLDKEEPEALPEKN